MINQTRNYNNSIRINETLKKGTDAVSDNSNNSILHSTHNITKSNWSAAGKINVTQENSEPVEISHEHGKELNHSHHFGNDKHVTIKHCCHDEPATESAAEKMSRVLGLPYVEPIPVPFNLTTPSLRNLTSIRVFLHQINEFIGFAGKFYVCAVLVYCFIISALTMYLGKSSPYS